MLRRLFETGTCSLLLVIATGSQISAQDIRSPYAFIEKGKEVTAYGGYFGGAEGQFGLGPKAAPMFGARFGFELTGPFALEFDGWITNTTRDVVDPAGADGPTPIGEAQMTLAGFEARPRMSLTGRRTWNGFQPYITGGLGLIVAPQGTQQADLGLEEEDRFQAATKFNVSGGGGLRFLPGDRLVGRLEFLAIFYKVDTPGGFSDPALDLGVVPEDAWVAAPTVALSLGIRF